MSEFTEVIKKLVFDAAPCEISSIYESLLTITDNKNKDIILEVLGQYNVEKRIPIDLDGSLTIISEFNKLGSKFFDPIRGLAFSVDNLRNKAIDVEQYEVDASEKQKVLYEQLQTYVTSTFPAESACAVLPNGVEDELVLIIVSTKFSPDNYWSGYWKSEYTYNTSTNALKGNITVSAHYYEDGNVTFNYPGVIDEENIADVVKAIQRQESSFESNLDQSFKKVNETQFVKLRRRLPVTRSKINWGKAIGGYRLGKDAAKGK